MVFFALVIDSLKKIIPCTVVIEVMRSFLQVAVYGIALRRRTSTSSFDSLSDFEQVLLVEFGHTEGQKERGLA